MEASIRLRSGGSDELSLQLLDAAVAFGLRSGLVNDNRAWALVGRAGGQKRLDSGMSCLITQMKDCGLKLETI